ncbi:MAG: hypothetical protein SWK76_02450 [Actinomycetota bacterium]|nr:hypothetical protein [Actinomycetota bacterium]
MSGVFGREEYRSAVVLTLLDGFTALLAFTLIFGRLADDGYRTVFYTVFMLSSVGLALLAAFFGIMGVMLGDYGYGILLAVMLSCYGLALIMVGTANHFLSQRTYRAYIYDFARQLPHVYYRYRT